MPPVIAAAVVAGGLAAAEGVVVFGLSTTLSAFVIGAGSLILGGIQYALAPKPPKANFTSSSLTGSTTTVRQADSTRKHVYGVTRFTDVFAQVVSTGVNAKLHAFCLICDDEIDGWLEIWADQEPITPDMLDAEGNVISGMYAGFLRIRMHLGSPTQAADPVAVSEVDGWTNTCRLQGIAYAFITMTKSQDVYPNGEPNFSFIVRGKKIFDPRFSKIRWTPNVALFCYSFLNQDDYGFKARDVDMDLTNISASANICDEIVETVNLDTAIVSIDTASDIITLHGTVSQYEFCDRVEILTTGTAPGGLSTGVDYYVIPYQIQKNPRVKLATTLDNAIDQIAIDLTTAGTGTLTLRKTGEPRYHGNGSVDTNDPLKTSLNNMLSGMAGRVALTGGAWRLLPGAWQEPTLTLDEGDMRGSAGARSKVAMADRFNTLSGVFISQINQFQPADYPPYRNQAYIDADKDEYPQDYPLAFTSRPTTAKRITKLEILKSRLEKVFTVPFSMAAMASQAGDNVSINYARRGWVSKVFEMTQFGFNVTAGDDNNMQLLTNLTLRETDESIYAWAASQDDPPLNIAPNTNLPDAFNVPVVTGFAFSSRAISTVGGDTTYELSGSWDLHPDAFVQNFGEFEIQYKKSVDPDWLPSFFVSGSLTKSDILASSPNTLYDLRIRAVNNLGVRSGWTTILNAIVGSSGGVGTTLNYQGVTDSVGTSLDYAGVTDTPGTFLDYGAVV